MKQPDIKKILCTTSTMPSSDTDPVPDFVKNEAIWLKKLYPHLQIDVLAPHNAYSHTKSFTRHKSYNEYRFHYFWPFTALEKLTGRGIVPALKKNKLLYAQLPTLFIAEFFATWKYARKFRPDLLYAHWFTPQAITAAMVSKLTGIPLIFDTQASDVIVWKKIPLARKMIAAVCKQAYAYTAPSQQTADKLLYFATDQNRQAILDKLHLIPYGTSLTTVSDAKVKAVRKQYKLEDSQVIYFIGRLVDRKGVDILVKAFAKLAKKDDTLKLVIAGDGQDRQLLEKLTRDLRLENRVLFTGYLTGQTKQAMLQIADVGVVPSINVGDQAEGLPLVFMEGVSCGKVMVISDATGAHETVENGKNAFVAKAGSVGDLQKKLAAGLKMAAANDKQFQKAVEQLSRQFQWPEIIRRRYEAFRIGEL